MAAGLQLNVQNFKKDAYITIEGKSSNNVFYIIRSGNVSVYREALDETETLKPGDFFGVISSMSNHNHIETTQALNEVSVITVIKDQFPLLIQKNNPIAMKIILSFSKKLRELDTSMAELTLKSISTEDVVNLYDIGEYYVRQKQYNQAFYALYRFLQYCPTNETANTAKQILVKIKPYAKAAYLTSNIENFKRVYQDNMMIFCEHEPGHELFILQSGKVKITKMIDNKEVLLAVLKEGDIFGEMALLENKPRSASAISYGDTQLMAVNKENFKTMISSQPQLVTKLISLLAERTWVMYRQLANLKINSDLGRAYDMLLIQLEKNKIPLRHGASYNFDFGVKELLNMVGFQEEKRDVVNEFLNNKKFHLVDNKLVVTDIEEIVKQVEYYKKMQILQQKRNKSHINSF